MTLCEKSETVSFAIAIMKNIVVFFGLSRFLLSEENILGILLYPHYLQMIKHKLYLLLEKLDQLSNLNAGFVLVLFFLMDICCNSFVLSLIKKVTSGTNFYISYCRYCCLICSSTR